MKFRLLTIMTGLMLFIAACNTEPEQSLIIVSLVADGRVRTFQMADTFTVDEFLSQSDVDVEVNDVDRITPPRFTQLTDGMRITIVRVTETQECVQEEIPFEQEIVLNEGLQADEQRLAQVGQSGIQEICFRVLFDDGLERERIRVGQPTVIQEPMNEILIVGLETELEPIPINGTLAYVNNGNAWVMNGNSTTKRPLTTTSDLDDHVMSLSANGRYLLYTKAPADTDNFVNELWLIETSGTREPVQLTPSDVLYAEWLPANNDTISYSTSEVQDLFPFWRALNNVWNMRIDPNTGDALNVQEIVPESGGGLSGWWGTVYKWSPDGNVLAWVRADGAGVVDSNGELVTLVDYAPFRTSQPWSWRSGVSWSWDSDLFTTTVHGDPIGSEPADTSPAFDVQIVSVTGGYNAQLIEASGMWALPQFSPPTEGLSQGEFQQGYIAYLRSREPYNSINGEYDLWVADRDGSNARIVFPDEDQNGITSELLGLTSKDYVWSADGRQIALIYQGNLWVVDVETLVSHQLTFDGQSSSPVWSR